MLKKTNELFKRAMFAFALASNGVPWIRKLKFEKLGNQRFCSLSCSPATKGFFLCTVSYLGIYRLAFQLTTFKRKTWSLGKCVSTLLAIWTCWKHILSTINSMKRSSIIFCILQAQDHVTYLYQTWVYRCMWYTRSFKIIWLKLFV